MTTNLGFGGDSPYAATNPYLNKAVSDSLGNTVKAYNNSTAPAYTTAMVNSGSFGNSGVQQAQDESRRQLGLALGQQANNMYSQNYQFGQSQSQNQNQFTQNLNQNQNQFNDNFNRNVYNDTFNQNQQNYQNGINLLGLQNNNNQQNLGFGTQIQNAPMNYYQGFSNTANSIGNGFGTQTQTSSAQGNPLLGALGGAQIGSSIYNSYKNNQTPNYQTYTGDVNQAYGNTTNAYGDNTNPNPY